MTLRSCPHLTEIKNLLRAGHWPQAAPGELRGHAAKCPACSDHLLLTQAFQAERAIASSAVQLPPAGVLWWRAQLRRRNVALKRISLPLVGAQIFAALISVAATAAVLLLEKQASLRWLTEIGQSPAFNLSALWTAPASAQWLGMRWNLPYLLPALALALLVGGVVVYLSSEKP